MAEHGPRETGGEIRLEDETSPAVGGVMVKVVFAQVAKIAGDHYQKDVLQPAAAFQEPLDLGQAHGQFFPAFELNDGLLWEFAAHARRQLISEGIAED